ncbi:uncharacterized protein LOC121862548 [Homarus americanus]|uniref:Uncharacterized protein n=1 Tax=Homarus americanus TaxID=6706 RepID=A0A8J5N2F4_HOMAM|nr:uncharacterized protein LOC121862548 [Homarus americanus]KAG7171951.1 hypothetical protein Hamer_G000899 [Homarus americanus]
MEATGNEVKRKAPIILDKAPKLEYRRNKLTLKTKLMILIQTGNVEIVSVKEVKEHVPVKQAITSPKQDQLNLKLCELQDHVNELYKGCGMLTYEECKSLKKKETEIDDLKKED